MSKPKAHVSQKKKDVVKEVIALVNQYSIIGLVDLQNLPSAQLTKMKTNLRGKVVIKMTKARLLRLALAQSNKDLTDLVSRMRGMPALILTNDSPFKLYKTLEKNKSPAPAKPGQIATKDITIPEGKTPFAPGPIIGELGQLGIKAGIEEGKVAIKQAKVIVKEGEEFKPKVCELLSRLSIFPMEIGLNLVAAWENGTVFDHKILAVDEKAVIADLQRLHMEAISLAMYAAYPSKDTIKLLISKAHREASGVADSKDILTSENLNKLLAKADAQANAVKEKAKL